MAKTITVNTESLGAVTRTKLRKLVKEHGTVSAAARSIGVAPSTFRGWVKALDTKAAAAKASA